MKRVLSSITAFAVLGATAGCSDYPSDVSHKDVVGLWRGVAVEEQDPEVCDALFDFAADGTFRAERVPSESRQDTVDRTTGIGVWSVGPRIASESTKYLLVEFTESDAVVDSRPITGLGSGTAP